MMTQPTALEQQREDAQIGAAWRRLVALTDYCDLAYTDEGYQVDCEVLATDIYPTALDALTGAVEAIELAREFDRGSGRSLMATKGDSQ